MVPLYINQIFTHNCYKKESDNCVWHVKVKAEVYFYLYNKTVFTKFFKTHF